jgi:hypothetical protein
MDALSPLRSEAERATFLQLLASQLQTRDIDVIDGATGLLLSTLLPLTLALGLGLSLLLALVLLLTLFLTLTLLLTWLSLFLLLLLALSMIWRALFRRATGRLLLHALRGGKHGPG